MAQKLSVDTSSLPIRGPEPRMYFLSDPLEVVFEFLGDLLFSGFGIGSKKREHVFLVGFMGAGKSYIGKRLAVELGLPFCDLDAWIEKEQGRSIRTIFENEGERYFRKLEAKTLRSFKKAGPHVIATGGGVPCFYRNMNWMNRYGITVYLKTHTDLLVRRLSKEKSHRPLIAKLGEKALFEFIQMKLNEREKYYKKALLTFYQKENDPMLVEKIMGKLKYMLDR